MKKKKRLFIIVGIIILVAVIIILNLISKNEVVEVETQVADFGAIVSKVSGDGILKAKSQVNISAQVMGRVEKLYVKEGDQVTKGQLLCLLDEKSYRADWELVQAQFEQTQSAFARAETLFLRNLIAPQEYERAKTEFKIAKARLEQALDRLEKTRIVAPISGTIIKLNVEEGENVIVGTMNNPGTVLMVIADLLRMSGIVNVDETEVVNIRPGAKAYITIEAFPDTSFLGVVQKVGYMPKQTLTATEQSTDFEVEIDILQRLPEMRPGMRINAEIITGERDSVLVVPIQAVGRRKIKGEETQTLFVVEKGCAILKPVKTGLTSETEIEILDGIKAGDIVIVGPYKVLSRLKDGDKVRSASGNLSKQRRTRRTVDPFRIRRQIRRARRMAR